MLEKRNDTSARGSGFLAGGRPPFEGVELPNNLLLNPVSMDCSGDSPSGIPRSWRYQRHKQITKTHKNVHEKVELPGLLILLEKQNCFAKLR